MATAKIFPKLDMQHHVSW